ncbi:MAG: hypothetical protein V1721_06715 [Pseudomonadota bacterium]
MLRPSMRDQGVYPRSRFEDQWDEVLRFIATIRLKVTTAEKLASEGENGILIFSTLNRTLKSFMLGIVAAEYLLRWTPRGSHDWRKFVRPSELVRLLTQEGFETADIAGIVCNPLSLRFSLSRKDIGVNFS